MLALLGIILLVLFRSDLLPSHVFFSNDGPLGRLVTQCHELPQRFSGAWGDLNSVGVREGGAQPNISFGLMWLLKPFAFSKFYVPAALMILGLGAWCFFRRAGLGAPACIVGGLAAALNSGFFSSACWGVAAHPITFGMGFLAMAALLDVSSPRRWLSALLAGLAIGMGVSEGADIGAILSLYVVAFVLWQVCFVEGPRLKLMVAGIGRLAVVTVAAGLLAASAISGLVATNISGVAGTQQDSKTRAERWEWATQWSLPKTEALGVVVPGLFGYRFDTPDGGPYWGTVGRAAEWDRYVAGGKQGPQPTGFTRYSGGGYYVGVPVLLLALWAGAQSLRRQDSAFGPAQRRWIWFWLGVATVSLLLAFGRHASFYRWLYALPYFSTIRNPIKFLHLTGLALVVLFGYGVDGLWRKYMAPARSGPAPRSTGFLGWWPTASRFEKRWLQGCLLVLVLSWVAWAVYAASSQRLEQYLPSVQVDEAIAPAVAAFSVRQVAWFELFFVLAIGLMALILSGAFLGRRARQGMIMLGLLVTVDLARADQPWVVFWDCDQKYLSNPIVDQLMDKPYEHRVALLSFTPPAGLNLLNQLYRIDWLQQLFPYYNIQSYDIVDMPRKPEDIAAFEKAFAPTNPASVAKLVARCWQLTNTRYLLGIAQFEQTMNDQADPAQRRLHLVERFNIVPKPGLRRATKVDDLTAVAAPDGPYGLFEFTGALPRAGLYTRWQTPANNAAALDQLTDPAFNPEQCVLVSAPLPPCPTGPTNPAAPHVEFASYASKDIVLRSEASSPTVLLLNDRYDPNWKVLIDGRPGTVLRCNYLMRGVYLDAGSHTVEFRFTLPMGSFYISLAATATGLLALGFALAAERRASLPPDSPAPLTPESSPAATSKPARAKRKQRGPTAAAEKKR